MAEIKVDCTGETCPIPLVETRKALMKAKQGRAGTYRCPGERWGLEYKNTQVEGGNSHGG